MALVWCFATPTALADLQPPPPPPLTTDGLITRAAEAHGVSRAVLYNVLKCESNLNPEAVGDGGTSFGIAQIHLPAHPEILQSEALDKAWAIDWTARQFSNGYAHQWTCYRILYER